MGDRVKSECSVGMSSPVKLVIALLTQRSDFLLAQAEEHEGQNGRDELEGSFC